MGQRAYFEPGKVGARAVAHVLQAVKHVILAHLIVEVYHHVRLVPRGELTATKSMNRLLPYL